MVIGCPLESTSSLLRADTDTDDDVDDVNDDDDEEEDADDDILIEDGKKRPAEKF